jgi:hypothetical protein
MLLMSYIHTHTHTHTHIYIYIYIYIHRMFQKELYDFESVQKFIQRTYTMF